MLKIGMKGGERGILGNLVGFDGGAEALNKSLSGGHGCGPPDRIAISVNCNLRPRVQSFEAQKRSRVVSAFRH